jgi:hypothetical protein
LLIEALTPLRLVLPERELSLIPGHPVDLPDKQARRLLDMAGEKVRQVVPDVVIEPAYPTAHPIYWEAMDRTWHGPVKPEYLGRTGSRHEERFWVIVSYRGTIRWIRSDMFRSRDAAERAQQGTKS